MTYSVLLVQRGISSGNHPVSGKSKKLYGQALQSPQHGGVAFAMSLPDYMAAAHDLIGNTEANQQWVPEFISSSGPANAHRCNRCPKPAVAMWDQYYYCLDDAPDNAIFMDGSGETVGDRKGKAAPAKPAEDGPKVDEKLSPGVTDDRKEPELPREDMRPPLIGTDREDAERVEGAEIDPELPPLPPQMKAKPTGEPSGATAPKPVVDVATAVVEQLLPQLLPQLDTIITAKVAAATKAVKDAKKKSPRPASEFTQLQKRAKKLKISSFGKSAAELRELIAEKEKR